MKHNKLVSLKTSICIFKKMFQNKMSILPSMKDCVNRYKKVTNVTPQKVAQCSVSKLGHGLMQLNDSLTPKYSLFIPWPCIKVRGIPEKCPLKDSNSPKKGWNTSELKD